MHCKHGIFWPNSFPWDFDSALSVVQKLSILNQLSPGVLRASLLDDDSALAIRPKLRQVALRDVIDNLYSDSEHYFTESHFLADYEIPLDKVQIGPLKICYECMARGLMPELFKLRSIDVCPWHGLQLFELCTRCQQIEKFWPLDPISRHGYSCSSCGYSLPNAAQIMRLCLKNKHLYREKGLAVISWYRNICAAQEFCSEVYIRPQMWERFSYQFSARTIELLCEKNINVGEFPLNDSSTYYNQYFRTLHKAEGEGLARETIEETYQSYCRFAEKRLLTRHIHCLELMKQDALLHHRNAHRVCLLALAYYVFINKFGSRVSPGLYLDNSRLQNVAVDRILAMGLSTSGVRRYFSLFLFKIISFLVARAICARGFYIVIDRLGGFYEVFRRPEYYALPRHRLAPLLAENAVWTTVDLPRNFRGLVCETSKSRSLLLPAFSLRFVGNDLDVSLIDGYHDSFCTLKVTI